MTVRELINELLNYDADMPIDFVGFTTYNEFELIIKKFGENAELPYIEFNIKP